MFQRIVLICSDRLYIASCPLNIITWFEYPNAKGWSEFNALFPDHHTLSIPCSLQTSCSPGGGLGCRSISNKNCGWKPNLCDWGPHLQIESIFFVELFNPFGFYSADVERSSHGSLLHQPWQKHSQTIYHYWMYVDDGLCIWLFDFFVATYTIQ